MKEQSYEQEKFKLDGKPPLNEAIPLALQHVVAMFVGNIAPVLIISRITNLPSDKITILIQCAMFTSAIATLIQLYPLALGKGLRIGAKLPVIMGTSFGFLPTVISIVEKDMINIPVVFGAQIVGGICSIFMGLLLKKIRKFFPPIVTGTVVLSIGLSLFPIGINYMAGGVGSPTYGSFTNWGIALTVLAIVLYFNQFTTGIKKLSSILIGIFFGYLISVAVGIVNFQPVSNASWFAFPQMSVLGMPKFETGPIIAMIIMYLVTAVQAIGDLSATTVGGMGREVEDDELAGGVIGNGVSAVFSGLFNSFPTATYSQNVGIVVLTKVVSRYVMLLATICILLAGFIPKFGALIGTIPSAVIGGGTITVFSMITMTGIQLITKDGLSGRSMIIVGLSIAIGAGIGQVPQSIALFPKIFKTVFGSSVVISTILACILNMVFPHDKPVIKEKEAVAN